MPTQSCHRPGRLADVLVVLRLQALCFAVCGAGSLVTCGCGHLDARARAAFLVASHNIFLRISKWQLASTFGTYLSSGLVCHTVHRVQCNSPQGEFGKCEFACRCKTIAQYTDSRMTTRTRRSAALARPVELVAWTIHDCLSSATHGAHDSRRARQSLKIDTRQPANKLISFTYTTV
jgi:hypothetical protein